MRAIPPLCIPAFYRATHRPDGTGHGVAFQKLDQRLAALLAAKSNPIHATHQVIADELGSAREIVSRLLKGFADQGWVKLGREQITVTNSAALRKLATF